ncbi:MAG: PhzF family phenazine biosynthesis protein [bacterium]
MSFPIVHVDAFTESPFAGNPAAVCILPGPFEAGWMQRVAREMNLSETAFLHREGEGHRLRWFTPAAEVDLCGHATLASAHVLWEEGQLSEGEAARFETKSGLLTCTQREGWIEMDFPAEPGEGADPPAGLAEGLGVTPRYVARNRMDYLVEVDGEETLRALRPDHALLARIPTRGFIVTCRPDAEGFDFLSRFFAPGHGVEEDPVTGSAHCFLGPFWGARLGKEEMTGFQASARGGVVRVRLAGDRVILGGKAVTVMKGKLL